MAIKPSRKDPKLSPLQVKEVRSRFFLQLHTLKSIAEDYPVSSTTIKDAIHGRGTYEKFTDDIPQAIKENRMQARMVTATPKSVRARQRRRQEKGNIYGNQI